MIDIDGAYFEFEGRDGTGTDGKSVGNKGGSGLDLWIFWDSGDS